MVSGSMILHGFTSFFKVLNIKISYMLLVVLLVTVPSISQINADKSFHHVGQVFAPVDHFLFPWVPLVCITSSAIQCSERGGEGS